MYKKTLLLFVTSIASTFTFAQEAAKSSEAKFHFGFKAVPLLAWMSTDSKGATSDGSKFGFGYGLVTEFNFGGRYAFATGVEVAYRGGKFKSTLSSVSGDTTTTINNSSTYSLEYIEIPLTLKLKTNQIGYITYFLQLGVSPGLNIRARADEAITTQTSTSTYKKTDNTSADGVDIQDKINTLNVSMIIAGGLEYTLSGSTVLLAGLTFNNGFLDVMDEETIKANSNYLGLTVGILF